MKRMVPLLYFSLLFFLIPSYSNASVVNSSGSRVTSGLMLHWTFDGQNTSWSSNTISDKSGNGRTGTIALMATSSTPSVGVLAQAFNFVESGLIAGVTSATFAPPGTGFSMSFWMKTTQGVGGSPTPIIIGWGNRFARLSGVSANTLNFSVDGGTAGSAVTGCSVNDGRWHHIVFTSTASAQNIYCDTAAGTSATETLDTTTDLLVLGKAASTDTIKYTGKLDDVRVYNRVLLTSEIQTLYNLGSQALKANTSRNSSLTSGLVGYWTMDGKNMNWTQNRIADSSTQGNAGQLLNMSTTTSPAFGRVGQALKFDATNDCIDMGTPSALNITGAVTVAAWVKYNSSSLNRQIAGKSSVGGGASTNQYHLYDGGSNRVGFAVQNAGLGSSLTVVSNSNTITTGQWTHVVGTYNGSDTVRVYINGAQSNSGTSASYGTLNQSGKDFVVGATHGGSLCNGGFFDGLIDDVRVYNRDLSATEVNDLFLMNNATSTVVNASLPGRLTSGLIGYWTFDGKDMPSGRAIDVSGNGNTGYLVNTATTTIYTRGKIGQGLNFDGVDDYVQSSSSVSGAGLTSFSYSFWMKTTQTSTGSIIDTGTAARFCRINVNAANKINCTATGSSSGSTLSTSSINDGKWHHIAYVSTSGSQTLYVDGVSESTTSQTLNTNNGSFFVGNLSNLTSTSYYFGALDDVRIYYNKALTEAEVRQLYNLGR